MHYKDSSRSVRDRTRDNTPASSRAAVNPQKSERKQEDRLKGFAYFDTFSELEGWKATDVDPLQRANTPLLKRPPVLDDGSHAPQARVTLIHDYAGGYHDYEACQGAIVAEERYSCEHLQFVDTFVYFSHHLVTVPPPTWINTCHRSGVKVLGTFIIEPGTEHIERMFHQTEVDVYVIAKQLTLMAEHYGFDGWLVNIEESFPILYWDPSKMEGFLRQLRNGVDKVIWYDALTELNIVWYTNTLSAYNVRFALAAGHLLTNYAWTEFGAQYGRERAQKYGMPLESLSFGIDVWAQDTRDTGPPRTTWPEIGGGGTMTGAAVAKLAEMGLSAGIFAPAWAFEHFETNHKAVLQTMWDGDALPEDLQCSCRSDHPHTIAGYKDNPITASARHWPAGSKSFLYADFRRAFSCSGSGSNEDSIVAHLGRQSVLPPFPSPETLQQGRPNKAGSFLYGRLQDGPPRAVVILEPGNAVPSEPSSDIRSTSLVLKLFDLNITYPGALKLSMTYRKPSTPRGLLVTAQFLGSQHTFFLEADASDTQTVEIRLSPVLPDETRRSRCEDQQAETLPAPNDKTRVAGFAVSLSGASREALSLPVLLLEILELHVAPVDAPLGTTSEIGNVRMERRGPESVKHWRLCWDATWTDDGTNAELPQSMITGPFSHFVIRVEGREAGVAHALEFVLPDDVEGCGRDKLSVNIEGVGFDGSILARAEEIVAVRTEEEDWELVDLPHT